MIQKFISDVCNILDISIPSISYDTSNFQTDTMMAQCKLGGDTIYIKKYDNTNPDQLFSIAHELRHIWQTKQDYFFYFSTYKPANQFNSIEDYNLQIAELDTNAFAGLIMINFFHLQPLFNGLSNFVKSKIYERIEYLKTTILFE